MFAIFTVVPGYSWESLLVCFRTSPLYNIDELVKIIHQQISCVQKTHQIQTYYHLTHLRLYRAEIFHQILHDSNHQVLVSTFESPYPAVAEYHQMYRNKQHQFFVHQLIKLYFDKVIFSVQFVQQQMNTSDCGIFAIEFRVKLLFGGDPTTVLFDVGKMRSYLHHCLQNRKFDHCFPKVDLRR